MNRPTCTCMCLIMSVSTLDFSKNLSDIFAGTQVTGIQTNPNRFKDKTRSHCYISLLNHSNGELMTAVQSFWYFLEQKDREKYLAAFIPCNNHKFMYT